MGRKIITYGFIAIGAYLALRYFQGASKDTHALSSGGVGLIKAFQGR